MSFAEIMAQVIDGEITQDEAQKLASELEARMIKVDVTKPRLQKDGKLCVMPGTTFTAYQLIRTKQVCDELLAIAKREMAGAERVESGEGRPNKSGEKDAFSKHYAGKLLVAYKPEHVATVKAYFAKP